MTRAGHKRGGAPIGVLTDLDPVEASAVRFLRLWSEGPESRDVLQAEVLASLGEDHGRHAYDCMGSLFGLCARHCRRPLARHALDCECLGADEGCFANFIACAAEGAREDAMLIATLLVRADMAPSVAALAQDVGLAFARMALRDRRPRLSSEISAVTTLH